MNEHEVAKILQIFGVAVGVLGGIILNPTVMKKSASWFTRIFLKPGDALTHTFETIKSFLPEISAVPGVKYGHFMSLVMFSNWILLALSLLFRISWLFWLSVSFFSLYLLIGILFVILEWRLRRHPFKVAAVRMIKTWTYGLIISPIFHLLLVIFYYAAKLIVRMFASIARRDRVRRILIVSGSVILLGALVWEYFLI